MVHIPALPLQLGVQAPVGGRAVSAAAAVLRRRLSGCALRSGRYATQEVAGAFNLEDNGGLSSNAVEDARLPIAISQKKGVEAPCHVTHLPICSRR